MSKHRQGHGVGHVLLDIGKKMLALLAILIAGLLELSGLIIMKIGQGLKKILEHE
jgi:hypothetical protein